MVADFPQLHEDVDHRHEVTTRQCFPCPINQTCYTDRLLPNVGI